MIQELTIESGCIVDGAVKSSPPPPRMLVNHALVRLKAHLVRARARTIIAVSQCPRLPQSSQHFHASARCFREARSRAAAKSLDDDREFDDSIDDDVQTIRQRAQFRELDDVESLNGADVDDVEEINDDASLAPVDLTDVTVVNDRASAARVLAILTSDPVRQRYHAIDTEVADINLTVDSPVGHGTVTCITIYVGPDIDFGTGPRLFIDCLDTVDNTDMFEQFGNYFRDASIKKIFHNFSFDAHVFRNHGVTVGGFAGDTMHMARLWDSSKMSYSLESLSKELCERSKISMKTLFAVPKMKADGMPGKAKLLPTVTEIQRGPMRDAFVDYATYDAQSTWQLRNMLEKKLRAQSNPVVRTVTPPPLASHLCYYCPTVAVNDGNDSTMFDFYELFYIPFAAMLVDMEHAGIRVRVADYLPEIEARAKADQQRHLARFLEWAQSYDTNAQYLNIASNQQKRHFFFGQSVEKFDRLNTEGIIEEGKKKAKKKIEFPLQGLGMPPVSQTKKKDVAVSLPVMRKLCGRVDTDRPQYGLAHDFFTTRHGGDAGYGVRACEAIHSLCQVSAISTMLHTFIEPLQLQADAQSRVHASLNLNTETGRLSSRRPNLQNQPALEKDLYKIRDAFASEEGKVLIVADYGQLELRVLAHMTECRSMILAFEQGGDFHSRTAMGMYPHVRDAVESGRVALESGTSDKSVPLLKDLYASERRKAKTLNFSIAYGKTARGLASDWGTSLAEAEATLEAWYSDRPEVKQWQLNVIAEAHRTGATRSLMGRMRTLAGINGRDRTLRSHLERAAINTPIQGGAADVVMMSMIKLHSHERFRALGWRAILQIHDEIIAEGPRESVDEAITIVRQCMEHPFDRPLLVALNVDAKWDTTWYRAK